MPLGYPNPICPKTLYLIRVVINKSDAATLPCGHGEGLGIADILDDLIKGNSCVTDVVALFHRCRRCENPKSDNQYDQFEECEALIAHKSRQCYLILLTMKRIWNKIMFTYFLKKTCRGFR
ncbi:MAG: hypothetical protein A4E57_00468 [Syntrophorhabdaceae bacterium PtaU1.Bin034]|nr:MAG: hypothetical protein A4E57_00468 [Syntrophorhabdaceae bacterium PtaU1.Bin034]